MVSDTGPSIDDLARLFGDDASSAEVVTAEAIPEPYRQLLVHPHHMTVTVEEFYGGPVDVRVLDRRHDGGSYARKILLAVAATGHVVQFGIVRIRLNLCSEPVRQAIVAEATPLGRILIEHDVLRRIEPIAFLKMHTNQQLAKELELRDLMDVWGRLAIIYCDGQPAIELLEILAPVT